MSEERLKEIKDKVNSDFEFTNYITLKDERNELYNEVVRLREELSKCTRKHWQSKCAEHCINEKLLQARIDKAVKHLETDLEINGKYDNEEIEPLYSKKVFAEICNELLVILRGKDNV